ncbi:MAG: serine hydrolase [Chloracidobacterium sp.]|nr:serine hydrolase [Chloracidobacterium sp.]
MKKLQSRRMFLGSAAGAAITVPLAVRGQTKRSAGKGLSDAFLADLLKLMEWANVPGLAVAILKNGKLSWSRGFGVKKAGENDPVNTDTMFGAASLSKPVLAYAIVKMRDEKLIDLDRPLWNYLPYEDLPDGENAKLITARHVLTHSTGLPNWRRSNGQKLQFAFKPGERFQYSGEGFYYLQRVIETITGGGFEHYMQERVLKPLGMTNSTFVWRSDAQQRISWGHSSTGLAIENYNSLEGRRMLATAEKWNKPLPEWKHDDVVRAATEANKEAQIVPNFLVPNTAGSLITSVDEYSRFLTRLMGRDSGLSEQSRREMLSPQLKVTGAISWGLGIALETIKERPQFWHWGDNGTFKAFTLGDAAPGSAIVIFTNGQQGQRLWQRIAAEAMGPEHPAFYFYMT